MHDKLTPIAALMNRTAADELRAGTLELIENAVVGQHHGERDDTIEIREVDRSRRCSIVAGALLRPVKGAPRKRAAVLRTPLTGRRAGKITAIDFDATGHARACV